MSTNRDSSAVYLSVVVAALRGDCREAALRRLQATLDCWVEQANRLRLASEFIVVEWGLPAPCPALSRQLRIPASEHCGIEFLQAPDDCRANSGVARNAGIRRARGQFILATNPGIVFSAELMQFLAARALQAGAVYRVDRSDVTGEIPHHGDAPELLSYCEAHTSRTWSREGPFEVLPGGQRALDDEDISPLDGSIELGKGWFPVENGGDGSYRWIESAAEILIDRPDWGMSQLILEVEPGPSAGGPLALQVVDAAGEVTACATVDGRCRLTLHVPDASRTGRFTIQVLGGRAPLAHDLRLLNLRVWELRWRSRWEHQAVGRSSIRVPGLFSEKGATAFLDILDVGVEHIGEGEHVLTVRLKERSAHRASRLPAAARGSGWRVDVTSLGPAQDWSLSGEAAISDAARILNAAYLHAQGSDDFLLLSRDHWFGLRGYPEIVASPAHKELLFCYSAHHAGVREVIADGAARIFRILHEGEEALTEEASRLTVVEEENVRGWIVHMRRWNAPMIFNRSDWGLGKLELPRAAP